MQGLDGSPPPCRKTACWWDRKESCGLEGAWFPSWEHLLGLQSPQWSPWLMAWWLSTWRTICGKFQITGWPPTLGCFQTTTYFSTLKSKNKNSFQYQPKKNTIREDHDAGVLFIHSKAKLDDLWVTGCFPFSAPTFSCVKEGKTLFFSSSQTLHQENRNSHYAVVTGFTLGNPMTVNFCLLTFSAKD